MSSNNSSSKVVTVDEQAFEQAGEQAVDEGRFPVVDETPEFEATVEQETQAKVDANHPDGIADTSGDRIHGATLAQEERIRAREEELERISAQAELGQQDGRAWRTRQKVEEMRRDERTDTQADPRAKLDRETLAEVNQYAQRLADDVDSSYTRAVIAKRIASRILEGAELFEAVMETKEEMVNEAGTIVPIGRLEEIDRGEVSVEGRIIELWEPSSPKIEQVGLIADDSGRTKWTSWKRSKPKIVQEGEWVQMRAVKKNWYRGRCSLAVTSDTRINFPERDDRWWEE